MENEGKERETKGIGKKEEGKGEEGEEGRGMNHLA